MMTRRKALQALFLALPCTAAAEASEGAKPVSVEGRLGMSPGGRPYVDTADHKQVFLHGDAATLGVLKDERLSGMDFEALGRLTAPVQFEIDPIHERAMFVHKNGKRLMVAYWCPVCYIRTYTPGPCWCCQRYTDLDLRESVDP